MNGGQLCNFAKVLRNLTLVARDYELCNGLLSQRPPVFASLSRSPELYLEHGVPGYA